MADIKHKRCSNCLGRGHFEGMGHMGKRKCIPCKGVGYTEPQDVSSDEEEKPLKKGNIKRKKERAVAEAAEDID